MQISKTSNQPAAGRRKKTRRPSFRHWWKKARPLTFVLLCVIAAVMLIPIVFTFLYSFFPKSEISDYLNQRSSYDTSKWLPVLFSPSQVSLRQYYKILIEQPQYLKLFLNSVKYSVGILLGQAVIIPMTAYGLSRFRFKGRDALFFLVLVLMLLPFQVTMAPSVMTLRALGILNTPWAVILPMWFSPFYLFLVRQFMLGLPNEILEAGQMDGAGTFRCLWQVVLPVCRPIIGASVALSFADCWNLVEQPLIYLTDSSQQPLSVMFNQINTDSADVQELVRERVELIRLGDRLNLDGMDSLPVKAAKAAIVNKVIPGMNLKGRGDAYLDAAYDIAKSKATARRTVNDQRAQVFNADSANGAVGGSGISPNDARAKMIAKYKQEKED